ncbi:MAG: hypothetical protein Q4G65_16685 [bacterium]|nr:hypothetical protein [bacterium]
MDEKNTEKAALSLKDVLDAKGIDSKTTIVDCQGTIYPPGSDLASVPYVEDAKIEVFRVVSGG